MTANGFFDSNGWYWSTGTATVPNNGYTITIPTTITVSGSWFNNWSWNGLVNTGSIPDISPSQYGRWVPGTGSMFWEEHVPGSEIPVFSKKEVYTVLEKHARPYDLYDWIKLNMWEKEGKIVRDYRDFVSGSWI